MEAKIAKLKILLANSRTLDASKVDTSQVQILNKVTIKNVKNNAKMTYTLVPETEADLKSGKISVTTPIAKGLLGKKVGDQVEIKIPAGTATFEIIEISI